MVFVEFECGYEINVYNEDAVSNKMLYCPECREIFNIVSNERFEEMIK